MTTGQKPAVLLLLFLLCLAFHQVLSLRIDPQCSMDAAFYSIVANRFAQGLGLTEPFIWHYLKPYAEIIHPIDYWQPLGIILYSAVLKVFSPKAAIFLNHIIWASLAVLVYLAAFRLSQSRATAALAFLFFAVGGKYAYYVSTTDNIAFYALFGYFFIQSLIFPASHSPLQSGFTAGLLALTRVEGIFFGGMACLVYLKRRQFRECLLMLLVFVLTLLPWMVRNYQTFGVLWTSNSKAIFMENYSDMFNPAFEGTLQSYLARGTAWIVSTKIQALKENLVDFFYMPAFLLLLPFWITGIIATWRMGGRLYAVFLIFFWFLNGALFTVQSVRGTAFHNVAAFIPHGSIIGAIGAHRLYTLIVKRPTFWGTGFIGLQVMLWVLYLTITGVNGSIANYEFDNGPYRCLLSRHPLTPGVNVISDLPVQVYQFTSCPGIMVTGFNQEKILEVTKTFPCGYALFDSRYHGGVPLPELASHGWRLIASTTPLVLWEKIH